MEEGLKEYKSQDVYNQVVFGYGGTVMTTPGANIPSVSLLHSRKHTICLVTTFSPT